MSLVSFKLLFNIIYISETFISGLKIYIHNNINCLPEFIETFQLNHLQNTDRFESVLLPFIIFIGLGTIYHSLLSNEKKHMLNYICCLINIESFLMPLCSVSFDVNLWI